ncbi:MAG: capsule biosynthesis protein, partial [Tritonibacter mobilis]|nr:capsule biosynthesis protein [Tritonibacter mobilis]
MTTKPKAKKFRIRRTTSEAEQASETEAATARPVAPPQPQGSDGAVTGGTPSSQGGVKDSRPAGATAQERPSTTEGATVREGQVSSANEEAGPTDIEEIKREGLTGRQLRLARRVAQKHDLPATSDYDAVRLLRQRGIDPFKRANMLELVVPQGQKNNVPATQPAANAPKPQTLPQTVDKGKTSVAAPGQLSPAERRNREIRSIQRDIARRRRRKMALLGARLGAFVLLPTFIAGFYYYNVATPMYASHSEFLVLKADSAGASGFGGLLSGTQFATSQDSIAVQAYLQSKVAMRRLDEEAGFRTHFSQDWIDPIQRLTPDATNDDAYKIYKRNVKIGYDPTEGVVRMEVSAAEPEVAAEFSRRLIS